MRRVLSEEEVLRCQLVWDNERAMFAAELAVMYSSSGGGKRSASQQQQQEDGGQAQGDSMDATPTPSAARSRDSGASRKRKLIGSSSDESDADTHAVGGSSGMAPARGYVEVCGLELPQRQAGSGQQGAGGDCAPPLVHTPAVDRNLEAVALGERNGTYRGGADLGGNLHAGGWLSSRQ